MNYEEARQIGAGGPAPGKWNWTNFNNSIQPNPFTVAPCAWPDFDWPEPPLGVPISQWPKVTPTGRERCDHDTREEAERHHYDHDLARVRVVRVDLRTIQSRSRCDVPDCTRWETYQAMWPDGFRVDSLCAGHRVDGPALIHPFSPGIRSIHS